MPAIFLLAFLLIPPSMSDSCPWLAADLHRWSSPLTWGDLGVPKDGDVVVVEQAILLDTETARLDTISIRDGGSLVFSPDVELAKLTSGLVKIENNGSL